MTIARKSVQIIDSRCFGDDRGWFKETYNRDFFQTLGIECSFLQDNHSYSRSAFTLRGLHFQTPDHVQAKLVRCVRGRIFDVAVDIREDSPTFGRWVGSELSAANGLQMFIPGGFAHGFLTLEPDCEVCYKCSDIYQPSHDGGLRWNDPDIGIEWPLPEGVTPILSAKDELQPFVADFETPFPYDGVPLAPLD